MSGNAAQPVSYGIPLTYIPNYEGVTKERRFNDALFAVLFVACFVAFLGVVGYSAKEVNLIYTETSDEWSHVQSNMVKNDIGGIAGFIIAAIVAAFAWVYLLYKFPKTMIYITLVATVALFFIFGIIIITVNVIAGVFTLLFAALVALLMFRQKARIQFTSVILKESTLGLSNNLSLMFVVSPVLIAVALGFFMILCVGAVHTMAMKPSPDPCNAIVSSYNCGYDSTGPNGNINSVCYWDYNRNRCVSELPKKAYAMLCFQVFSYFWTMNFGNLVFQCICAGAIAKWYFSRGTGTVLGSVKNTLYASGSLALGSLIVAIIQFCKFLLRIAEARARHPALMVLACCLRCLCSILEAFIRYINRYAVIYIAMYGTSFMESAKSVFNLFERSGWQVLFNDIIVHYVVNFGTLMGLLIINIPAAFVFLVKYKDSTPHVISFVIVLIGTFAVFLIASGVLRIAVDTIMVCFCEDMERNAQSKTFVAPQEFLHCVCAHDQCPTKYKQYATVTVVNPGYNQPAVVGVPMYQGQPNYQQPGAYQAQPAYHPQPAYPAAPVYQAQPAYNPQFTPQPGYPQPTPQPQYAPYPTQQPGYGKGYGT